MYKREMRLQKSILVSCIVFAISCGTVLAETAVRDSSVKNIAQSIARHDFSGALVEAKKLRDAEPENPLGYFLVGTVYQTASEESRNDEFSDSISENLDTAIDMAEELMESDPDNPNRGFIAGAGRGYRALHRAFHGNWWGAFQDGLKAGNRFDRALELDSTFYDAYLGLGAYDYYRTVKARAFLWLPFVSDKRDTGIAQVKIAIAKGVLAQANARESLLRIYYEEKQYDDAVSLGDSLLELNPGNLYARYFMTTSLIELEEFPRAWACIDSIENGWKNSAFYDSLGAMEGDYLKAVWHDRRGEYEETLEALDRIIKKRGLAGNNAYFEETVDKAKKLHRRIQ